jgi:hypothetical protein
MFEWFVQVRPELSSKFVFGTGADGVETHLILLEDVNVMKQMNWQTSIAGMTVGLALAFGTTGCKSNNHQAQPAQVADLNNGPDPAAANMVPVTDTGTTSTGTASAGTTNGSSSSSSSRTRVLSSSQSAPQYASGEQYQNQQYQNQPYQNQDQGYAAGSYDNDNDQSAPAEYAQQAPPPLPQYQQPELTEPGYIWTPGYWAYGSEGYYWVPGAWVAPPYQDALWTPGYWGYTGGRYGFHRGYWGRHIGYYGGINYGFGYVGFGYQGGYWNNNQFYYNNAVNHVDVNVVRTVYQRDLPRDNNQYAERRVSFNGPNGYNVAPRPAEVAVLHEQRTPPMQVQQQRVQQAAQNRQQFYAVNHGQPAVPVATQRFAADRTPPAAIQQHNQQVQQQQGHQQAQQRQQEQRAQPQARPAEQARPAPQQSRPQPQAAPHAQPQAAPRPQAQPQHEAPKPQERPRH